MEGVHQKTARDSVRSLTFSMNFSSPCSDFLWSTVTFRGKHFIDRQIMATTRVCICLVNLLITCVYMNLWSLYLNQSYSFTYIDTHTFAYYMHTLIHTHTHTHTHNHTHVHTHAHSHTYILTYTHSQAYTHTHTLTYAHAHAYTLSHWRTYTHPLAYTHTHVHTHTHAYTHTHINKAKSTS